MKWAKGQKPAAALLQGDSLVNQLGDINFGLDFGNLIGHRSPAEAPMLHRDEGRLTE